MMDEEKQINNTEHPQGDSSEVKRAMASDTTAQTNLNDDSEANAQVAASPNESSANTAIDGGTNTAVRAEAEYKAALSELSQQVESLKATLEDRNNQYMRMGADFENFRKRTTKEKEDLEQKVKRDTITELLPVVDNFERAKSQLRPQTDAEVGIHKSYQSVYRQLVDSLKRLGVSAMRPKGQEFDPNLHEAVIRQPTDEHPEGTVLEELVPGYFLGDRVLRHAMVKVAAAPEAGVDSEGNPPVPVDS